ncbi:MAG TPA: hypothetical protein VE545_04480 [Candidatus Dormibacteraeota bacterium]|nr:hypothetical protein [Candidatus Dormibacteraeota bacterium]
MRGTFSGAIVLVLLLAAPCSIVRTSAKEGPKLSKADAKKAAAVPKLGPAFETDPELMDGFRALYEQDFPAARAKFTAWCEAHPDEAFGQVSLAAGYLFDEFDRHGVLTSEFFMNDDKFLHGIEGEADPERMKGFHAAIEKARELANRKLKASPGDPNALFALTMAAGMESNDFTIVEKKHIDGLKRMKEANDYAKQVLTIHPEVIDVYVAPGSANYIIGCLSGAARFFLWFGGIKGDKKLGMEEVDKTAQGGRYLRGFAQILEALSSRREKQNARAEALLKTLTEEYPKSPLFAAEYAKVRGLPVPAQLNP